ncbi:MAG: aminotransferase class I/II-fold pyridoxal phosphate-dependent enzyme [Bacteroidota bacterium]
MLERTSLELLSSALERLEKGFSLPKQHQSDLPEMEKILESVADRMQDNYPYFHPLFAGQMLKPPHPVAKAAYMLALWINPNNHALDGGKASSKMEKEVVQDLATMIGWEEHLGHLTGGGTLGNLEALWIAGKLHPGKKIVGSTQAHYTHQRISEVLKLDYTSVASDSNGKMNLTLLEAQLKEGGIGTVICTVGTTGLGTVDPLDELLVLQKEYGFRIHADAAYGGYFALCDELAPSTRKKYDCLEQVDSIVIDPHKHGLQPYGCGCILFKDPEVAKFYIHDSPYTYFTSDDLHLGEISLECSRAGASAVALWATHQLLPPKRNGDFAAHLSKSLRAAQQLYQKLDEHPSFRPIIKPETDIVVWTLNGTNTTEMSKRALAFFAKAESNQLYLSQYKYPTSQLSEDDFNINSDVLICLRSCLMKPEHLDWLKEIWRLLILSLPGENS